MVPVYVRPITARSVAKTGRPIATAVMQSARKYAKRQQKIKKEKVLKYKTQKKKKKYNVLSNVNYHKIIHNAFMTGAKRLNARASVLVERRRPVIDA